jgi:ABC-2 type transport system permease protein
MAFGGFTAAMALKTGSSEAVQGSFPLLFITLFFSSAFFPRQTMQGTYKRIADINPVSHLVEGIRGLVIDGFTAGHVASALLVPTAIGLVSITLAMRTLYSRLAAR